MFYYDFQNYQVRDLFVLEAMALVRSLYIYLYLQTG